MAVTHLTFNFRLGSQSCHRVDHDHVDRTGANNHVAYFQRLFSGIRLTDQQVGNINAKIAGVNRIKCVLGIDKRAGATVALALRNYLQGQRGFTGRLRPIDFHDTTAWQTTNTQRDVQTQRPRRNRWYGFTPLVTETHHGALAKLPLYLR